MFVRTISALQEKSANMLLSLRKASSTEHGQLPYILSVADKSYCGALFFPSDFFMYLPVRTVDYD